MRWLKSQKMKPQNCLLSLLPSSFVILSNDWNVTKRNIFKDNKKVRLSLDFFSDGNLCFDFIVWGPLFWLGRPNFQTRPPIDMFTNQASWKVLSMVLDTRKKNKVCGFVSKQKEIDRKSLKITMKKSSLKNLGKIVKKIISSKTNFTKKINSVKK